MKTAGIAWEAVSLIDRAHLVLIALETDSNRKTGRMVQTYILRADVPPTEAARTGADVSVCGDCPHRPILTREGNGSARCYVNLAHGPRVVWEAWKRGRYAPGSAQALAELARGRMLRLGTYGDPGAVSASEWLPALETCAGWTGYTYRWQDTGAPLRGVCMASVDSLAEGIAARAAGWATFRVDQTGTRRERGEAQCPASIEAGSRATCSACPIGCNGKGLSVAILDHGPGGIARKLA